MLMVTVLGTIGPTTAAVVANAINVLLGVFIICKLFTDYPVLINYLYFFSLSGLTFSLASFIMRSVVGLKFFED